MDLVQAIVLGIVEGVTEYLPISSTFHLIFASKFLGIIQTDFVKAFEVVIQGGAILAVLTLFGRQAITNRQLLYKVAISFVPTSIIGLGLYKIIKGFFFENTILQLSVFILVGVLFIVFEKIHNSKSEKSLTSLSYRDAVMVGLAQAVAVVPGVSRAGAVMLALMAMGINRKEAAMYSFLLAVPTIGAAAGLDFIKIYPSLLQNTSQVPVLALGFFTAFISAVVAIKWLVGFLQKNSLSVFGWYRIIIGAVLLLS